MILFYSKDEVRDAIFNIYVTEDGHHISGFAYSRKRMADSALPHHRHPKDRGVYRINVKLKEKAS
jgi:hypothetical protein